VDRAGVGEAQFGAVDVGLQPDRATSRQIDRASVGSVSARLPNA
jgi:hypothetical protein